jgi:tripartite-type tricarboxylate transporter receptor subunit TctC
MPGIGIARRTFMRLAASSIALPAIRRAAWAEIYPSRPVHLTVGFPAGGTADVIARLLGQWLTERLGQPVVIDNRPGASSNVATREVARAAADGYALLFMTSSNVINVVLNDSPDAGLASDIAPIAGISRNPLIALVHSAFPPKTVPEFIAYAKMNPGKINMASAGIGTPHHLAGELLQMMTSVRMVHVPYRGEAAALTDLMAGQVQFMFALVGASIGHVRAGRLRALAVTTAEPFAALPDVPTVAQFVPGYEASGLFGLGAPKGTPGTIVETLNREVNVALADHTIQARFFALGVVPVLMTSKQFGDFIGAETTKWAAVIRSAGIKPE